MIIEVSMFMRLNNNIYNSRIGKNSILSVLDQILNLGINFLITILNYMVEY